jgi:hypothetical protein
LQGASAIEKILSAHRDPNLRVFVIWEKALITDGTGPNTRALHRVSDPRAIQFWDPDRLLSHEMGESKTGRRIWDWAGIYPHGTVWNGTAPQPVYSGRPVDQTAKDLEAALAHAL